MAAMTRRLLLALTLSAAFALPARAQKPGTLGGGVYLGDPIGLTGKYWLDDKLAIDAVWGFSNDMSLHADVLMHFWDLWKQPPEDHGRFALYIGGGAAVGDLLDGPDFNLRTPVGLTWITPKHPFEVFIEAAPVFELVPDPGVGFDAGIGVRFYFN